MSEMFEQTGANAGVDLGDVHESPIEDIQPAQNVAGESKTFTHWKDLLTDEFKENNFLKGHEDLNQLVKEYVNQKHLIGKKLSDLTVDELNEIQMKQGRPARIDDYEIHLTEPMNEDELTFAKSLAFKNGWSNEQLNENIKSFKEREKMMLSLWEQDQKRTRQLWRDQLKQEWGSEFESRVNTIKQFKNEFFTDGLKKMMDDPRANMGDNPEILKTLYNVAKHFEKGTYVGKDGGMAGGMTSTQALDEIRKMDQNPETVKILQDVLHPSHNELKDKRTKLFTIAYGD